MVCVLAIGVHAANDKKVLRLPCTVEPIQLSIAPKDLNANHTYRQLVVLVSFSDCDFSMEDPKATYDAMFNQNGYNQRDGVGCIADYFRDQSNGLFNLEFDVYGPIKVNSKAQAGSGSSADFRTSVFVEAMRTLTTQQPDINYAPYDWNGDGYVNQVIFVYAGYAGNQPGFTTYIWPSTGTMNSTVTTPDGYKIYSYSSSGELWSNNTSCGIGTICHEFSHCLGLPDIYPTNTNDSSLPTSIVDEWDLMDGGHGSNLGWCPPNFSPLEKMLLGWLTPTELTADTVITGMKPVSNGGEVYLIRHTENEYYLLENRQWQGWDLSAPGHGLLVWHVNYNQSEWNTNVVNNTNGKPNYHLVTADNLDYDAWLDIYKRGGISLYLDKTRRLHRCLLSSAPYPWATDSTDFVNNELTNTSTPAAIMYNKNAVGSYLLSKPITDITEHEDGTISFVFHATTPDGMITINREPLTNNHIYTLTGRKVQAETINSLPKGIYIIDGKKVIIR